jgi:uncharacterized protein YceH (UPF0502 family)
MERMPIKTYAVKHKLSIFNVVKMVKAGQLQSEVVEENGKEVTYILAEEPSRQSLQTEHSEESPTKADLEQRVAKLEQDVAILKRELDAFKMSMGIKG